MLSLLNVTHNYIKLYIQPDYYHCVINVFISCMWLIIDEHVIFNLVFLKYQFINVNNKKILMCHLTCEHTNVFDWITN